MHNRARFSRAQPMHHPEDLLLGRSGTSGKWVSLVLTHGKKTYYNGKCSITRLTSHLPDVLNRSSPLSVLEPPTNTGFAAPGGRRRRSSRAQRHQLREPLPSASRCWYVLAPNLHALGLIYDYLGCFFALFFYLSKWVLLKWVVLTFKVSSGALAAQQKWR